MSLFFSARSHIIDIDAENAMLKSKVDELQKEVQRLRDISDKMAMKVSAPFGAGNGVPVNNSGVPLNAMNMAAEEDVKDIYGVNAATPIQDATQQFVDEVHHEAPHVEPGLAASTVAY